jgi:hypothetical protein
MSTTAVTFFIGPSLHTSARAQASPGGIACVNCRRTFMPRTAPIGTTRLTGTEAARAIEALHTELDNPVRIVAEP